jgi:hypothetical protein
MLTCTLIWTDFYPVTDAPHAKGWRQEVKVETCTAYYYWLTKPDCKIHVKTRLIDYNDSPLGDWKVAETSNCPTPPDKESAPEKKPGDDPLGEGGGS